MNCQKIAEILDDGDDRGLSNAERREFEAHLGGCEECRAAVAAHEAMNAMAVPAMSPDFAERSRRLVVAHSAGRARRIGGRPFVVVGLLLAGAAAAAFLGLNVMDGASDDSESPEVAGLTSESIDEPIQAASAPLPEAGEASAVTDEPVVGAPGATAFTVGVSPLVQSSTNPEVIRISEIVYRAFLDELRKIPNIELVMLAADEVGTTKFVAGSATAGTFAVYGAPGGVIEFEAAGAANITNLIEPDSGGTNVETTRSLVLVDSRRIGEPGSDGELDLSTIPTALVGRIATVTGGASTSASTAPNAEENSGVVNVILDNNIEGVRVDLNYNTMAGAAVGMPAPEPLAYDVVLEVAASSRPASNSWNFTVNARSRSGGALSSGVGAEIGEALDQSEFIERLVSTLKAEVFPVDEASLAAVTANVQDRRLPVDEWLVELNRLKQMTGRAGNPRLADDVALAIVDMSFRITDPQQLSDFLAALEGLDNTVLVQPLGNALRNGETEAIRLEAAIRLASFRQDPSARAALEAAASGDPSPAVRLNARWAALDEAGHRNLIVTTLLDTRLTDAERIEPLLLDLGWARSEPADLGPAVDATVVSELSALLRRHEQAASRVRVLGRLQRESSPLMTSLFVERLNEDESEMVRVMAAQALRSRLDEPGARYALERAAVADPIARVRQAASLALGRGIELKAVTIGN